MATGRVTQTSATTVVVELSYSRETALRLKIKTRKVSGSKAPHDQKVAILFKMPPIDTLM